MPNVIFTFPEPTEKSRIAGLLWKVDYISSERRNSKASSV